MRPSICRSLAVCVLLGGLLGVAKLTPTSSAAPPAPEAAAASNADRASGTGGTSSSNAPLASFAEPAISPDGAEIAFVSAGDVWTVPSTGGEARLLVSHSATESRPLYSPDGT